MNHSRTVIALVWAATVTVYGGYMLLLAPNWLTWGRTSCNFDASGTGSCEIRDRGGLTCTHWGEPPNTLAEYALNLIINYC